MHDSRNNHDFYQSYKQNFVELLSNSLSLIVIALSQYKTNGNFRGSSVVRCERYLHNFDNS